MLLGIEVTHLSNEKKEFRIYLDLSITPEAAIFLRSTIVRDVTSIYVFLADV